ncbi:putative dTMP kinase [Burkholderia pseudomallei MSHR3016]|nr:putative dTMP kinase [Burkholderia pseudomallei BDU 2]KGW37148.1 putative dTMP kinase [Burkholderia pseudomallei MSHR3016]
MSTSAIRRAPIPRRSSQSCARWACDGRARGDDHGRHGGDGRCRRARGRARRARRRAGRRARPRISTSTRRGCPKRAQRGRRHARRRACAARGARSRRPPQARLSARAAFARRPRPPSAPAILRAGSNDVNRTTRALPSGVEQRAAPARRVANRRIDGVRRALGARERRASQHVVLARVRRGRAHRVAPYRVMMVSESASRRCDPVLGAPDAALDSGQRLSGRGAYACSACGRSGRGSSGAAHRPRGGAFVGGAGRPATRVPAVRNGGSMETASRVGA